MLPQTQNHLTTYLTAGLGAGCLAATADAAIINIDVTSVIGINAGLDNAYTVFTVAGTLAGLGSDFSFGLGHYADSIGLGGVAGTEIAIAGNYASPMNFATGSLIDSSATFTGFGAASGFKHTDTTQDPVQIYKSSDFTLNPVSHIGFRTAEGNYGWLKVTWDGQSEEFQILSGAYELEPGVGILAGAVAAVPEPASVLGTLGLLSAGMFVRRRRLAA